MKKSALFLTSLFAVSGGSHAGGGAHWGYSGPEGPEHWGSLSPDYVACSTGRNQSPVDVSHTIEADLADIGFQYQAGGREVVNNGHTIQVNYAPGSSIALDGHVFELKQFHFHSPSENRIAGISYPLEAHFVHADQDGNLAVVAVMFSEGPANDALAAAWAQMPEQAGGTNTLEAAVAAADLLPANHGYYRFNGSLTTPPCSEGVWWLVMKQPVSASKAQIEQFSHVMHHANNRPVQPLNARPILQ